MAEAKLFRLRAYLPDPEERQVVIFHIWPSLEYGKRLALSFGLAASGLLLQVLSADFWWGALPLALGNMLLLVRGYDNRVDFGSYDPEAEWVCASPQKLDELVELDRKARAWDVSALDVTNPLGFVVFLGVSGLLGYLIWATEGYMRILAADAALLLLPHWITGIRSILKLPRLMVKVATLKQALESLPAAASDWEKDVMVLLVGDERKLPEDVKLRLTPAGAPSDFLGLYGQVVINDVQGTSYPYFYVVVAVRKGCGLQKVFDSYEPPDGLVKEFGGEDNVEFIVIRQRTTKRSGYHTKPAAVERILAEGVSAAQAAAKK